MTDANMTDANRIRMAMEGLEELLSDFGEVIVNTAGHEWVDVKDQITGLTYEHVLDFTEKLERAMIDLGYDSPNRERYGR